jgi:xylulokinase
VPRKRTDVLHYQAALPSALPGRYLIANPQESAGVCLDFLKDNLRLRPDGQPATATAQEVYRGYEVAAAGSPAGASGVIFTPWLNGERCPVDDHTVRGGFHNLSLTTTQGDLIRAVYEGVAFNSRWLMNALERFTGRTLSSLTFIGGGANSDLWAQILADVLDRPIRQARQPQLSNARGAAFIGFVALGLADADDLAGRVPIGAQYTPNPSHRARYDELFAVFTDIYKRNRGLYAALNGER